MIHKLLFAFFVSSLFLTNVYPSVFYVSTTGNDANSGAIDSPFATVQRAQASVAAGDTVYIRGGIFKMAESQIARYNRFWAYVVYLDKSGTPDNLIKYWAFPGETPIFDFSDVKPANYRIHAFEVTGSYIHLKGLEVVGVQVTIRSHTQSICFSNLGSNNTYEQLVMRDGKAIGFYLKKGANNLVLNCDAFRNWDDLSGNGRGGNVDGFGFHPDKGGRGNIVRGCRAWFNSDDGYDCINSDETVVFENCWAFYNGFDPSFTSLADGNGFKIGGYGQAPAASKLPNPIPGNVVRFCMAYRNKANGFYANHHVETGSVWYHNSAYRNAVNFNMLSQKRAKSPTSGADTTIDCAGINHVLHNNLSLRNVAQCDTLNLGTSDISYNSFSPGTGVVVDENDFISLDESLLVAPRQANGDLPDNGFLRLKPGSDLVDKGKALAYAFNGAAPDLGAFELKKSQAIVFPQLGPMVQGQGPIQLSAVSSSGLPVMYISSNVLVAKVVGNELWLVGPGTATITAYQTGNVEFYAAPEVAQEIVVGPKSVVGVCAWFFVGNVVQ